MTNLSIVGVSDHITTNKDHLPLGTIMYAFVSKTMEVQHQLVFYRHLYRSMFPRKKAVGFADQMYDQINRITRDPIFT